MSFAEILVDDCESDPDAHIIKEWLVIDCDDDGHVSLRYEYQRRDQDWRNTWQDQGAGFGPKHLDEVIDALVRIRASLPSGGDP